MPLTHTHTYNHVGTLQLWNLVQCPNYNTARRLFAPDFIARQIFALQVTNSLCLNFSKKEISPRLETRGQNPYFRAIRRKKLFHSFVFTTTLAILGILTHIFSTWIFNSLFLFFSPILFFLSVCLFLPLVGPSLPYSNVKRSWESFKRKLG